MSKRLTIAIQKKGRLNQDSIDLITKRLIYLDDHFNISDRLIIESKKIKH